MTFHVMIIPTLNCPSNCKYCWGSENKKEMMDSEIIDQIITWLGDFRDDKVHFTFHGGEPLLAGYDFYEYAWTGFQNWIILRDFPFKATYGF